VKWETYLKKLFIMQHIEAKSKKYQREAKRHEGLKRRSDKRLRGITKEENRGIME
jgi:hypothetical protein